MDFILYPVQSGHQHGTEGQIHVAGGIRESNLNALGLGTRRIHGNPDARRAVPAGIGEQHRCFKARCQAFVRIRNRIGERGQGRTMLENPADIIQAHL